MLRGGDARGLGTPRAHPPHALSMPGATELKYPPSVTTPGGAFFLSENLRAQRSADWERLGARLVLLTTASRGCFPLQKLVHSWAHPRDLRHSAAPQDRTPERERTARGGRHGISAARPSPSAGQAAESLQTGRLLSFRQCLGSKPAQNARSPLCLPGSFAAARAATSAAT